VGLLLGLVFGLFFGELCEPLKYVGLAFIKLLQMTVLPYIIISLIFGLGQLSSQEAKQDLGKVVILLLGIWGLGFFVLFLMPLAFPAIKHASYYSDLSNTEEMSTEALLDLFIPSNIFTSLSNDLIPGVILFCIGVGVVLISVPHKDALMHNLKILSEVLERLAGGVAKFTPLGIFSIAASAAGTMALSEMVQLQVYVFSIIVFSLLIVFLILPGVIRCFLPISYRELLKYCKDPLLIAFTTGSSFIALPIVSERIKQLLHTRVPEGADASVYQKQVSMVDIVLPIAFAFPCIGDIGDLLFVLFAGWSYDNPVAIFQYPKMVLLGIPSLFAEINAIPFMLQQFHLPIDAFRLFILSSVATSYFLSLVSAMSLLSLTLLSAYYVTQSVRFRWGAGIRILLFSLVIMGISIGATRWGLTITTRSNGLQANPMSVLSIENRQSSKVIKSEDMPPVVSVSSSDTSAANSGHLLEDIIKRKVIRIGYMPNSMPWSYFNGKGELVGYDIALAEQMAKYLNCKIEYLPINFNQWMQELSAHKYDIAMIPFTVTPDRIANVDFTIPHRHLPPVFVTKDYRRNEFKTREELQKIPHLKIAVLKGTNRYEEAAQAFPFAELVALEKIDDFIANKTELADAWYTEAGKGYAYAIMSPTFTVVEDKEGSPSLEAFTVPKGEEAWLSLINAILTLQKESGFEDVLFNKWILGKKTEKHIPRWCVIRDVLHWIK